MSRRSLWRELSSVFAAVTYCLLSALRFDRFLDRLPVLISACASSKRKRSLALVAFSCKLRLPVRLCPLRGGPDLLWSWGVSPFAPPGLLGNAFPNSLGTGRVSVVRGPLADLRAYVVCPGGPCFRRLFCSLLTMI